MHLTDEQLNEYLDHETNDRARIELHLSTCADCATRLSQLQSLFDEIESLPDLALSPEFAVPIARKPSLPLPRALTLTLTLQATLAVVLIIVAAPFFIPLFSSYLSNLSAPAPAEIFILLRDEWMAWRDMLSKLQWPVIPRIPVVELSSLFLLLTVIVISLVWLIGNRLLLRNQIK
jgi:hypothetical protein